MNIVEENSTQNHLLDMEFYRVRARYYFHLFSNKTSLCIEQIAHKVDYILDPLKPNISLHIAAKLSGCLYDYVCDIESKYLSLDVWGCLW
jgi:hypothetical protein